MDPTADTRVRPVVLSDLAERLGVSTMTVSRALNDQPGVGAATRARVLALAAELGYRPNASARALVTGRNAVVGVIGCDIPYYGPGSVLDGMSQAARRLGYSLRVATLHSSDKESPDELTGQLVSEGVAGLVVAIGGAAAVAWAVPAMMIPGLVPESGWREPQVAPYRGGQQSRAATSAPSRTKTGMRSSGASASSVVPPSSARPVTGSSQRAPEGRYT